MTGCPDTNVWLEWSRAGRAPFASAASRLRVVLATVVLQEMWAGVRSGEERRYVEGLHALAHRHRRVLNPPAAAWILSGQALGLLRKRIDPPRLRALRNDVLLAATAFVHAVTVLTRNVADFRLIAGVLPVRFMEPPTLGER